MIVDRLSSHLAGPTLQHTLRGGAPEHAWLVFCFFLLKPSLSERKFTLSGWVCLHPNLLSPPPISTSDLFAVPARRTSSLIFRGPPSHALRIIPILCYPTKHPCAPSWACSGRAVPFFPSSLEFHVQKTTQVTANSQLIQAKHKPFPTPTLFGPKWF